MFIENSLYLHMINKFIKADINIIKTDLYG